MKIQTLRFPLTSVAVLLAIVVLLAALILDVNVIEMPLGLLATSTPAAVRFVGGTGRSRRAAPSRRFRAESTD
jgi:hypothetical protein